MRVLFTASRDLTDADAPAVIAALSLYDISKPTLVVGDEPNGGDYLATRWACWVAGWDVEVHQADWPRFGRAAGPLRNQRMVDSGADMGVAVFKWGAKNRGTRDCLRRATTVGIPMREVWV